MGVLRKLAGQSAVYGLSNIVPRMLNYFLVVLHSRVFFEAEYGVITELYAYIAILLVLLTFGLETGFFRFAPDGDKEQTQRTYASLFWFLGGTNTLFFFFVWLFLPSIGLALGYSHQLSYLLMLAGIISLDAWSAIIFAKLRQQERAGTFAWIKIISVVLTIAGNLVFLLLFPRLGWYNGHFGVGYVLLSNLLGSATAFILALLFTGGVPGWGSWRVVWKVLSFSFPLLISGLGGTTNEFLDRLFIKYLATGPDAMVELGIYGANVKIAVLMTLFVQMYKYAAEPYFLKRSGKAWSSTDYALSTKAFTYFCLIAMVMIAFSLPLLKYFVGHRYRVGLGVVPILLLANLLYGLYINVSMWYKQTKQTWYAVLFTFSGAAITVAINLWLTPRMGYYGAALARLGSYVAMTTMCIAVGQRFFPIPYEQRRMILAIAASCALMWVGLYLPIENVWFLLGARGLLACVLLGAMVGIDRQFATQLLRLWTRHSK